MKQLPTHLLTRCHKILCVFLGRPLGFNFIFSYTNQRGVVTHHPYLLGRPIVLLCNFEINPGSVQSSALLHKSLIKSFYQIVKLCVHFDLWSLEKWTKTDNKVTFHPPSHPPAQQITFYGVKWKVWPRKHFFTLVL